MYFFPTDTDVTDFSKGRAKPLIESNPYSIASCMEDTDSVGIKKVAKAFIYFRGMKSRVAVKSVPADMVVFDELDEAPPESVDMARKRMSHSKFQYEIALSNPTIPNYGIDAEFQKSDQHYWLMKCPHCGEWNNVVEQFPDCIQKGANGMYISCRKCGLELDRNNGDWVPKYPSRTEVRGYQYSQLIAPFIKINSLWSEYQAAIQKGRLQVFHNLTLGLAYVSAKEKLTKEQVLELCDPRFPDDPWDLPGSVFMGIDQGRDLHVVFKKRCKDKVLTWFVIEKDFEALDKYMKKVARCVIDALPETRKAREFALRHPGQVYLNFYVEKQKGEVKWDDEEFICQENRTESMDASHAGYHSKKNVLPPRSPEAEEFAEHCSNVAKKLDEDEETGSKRYIWVKLGEDHFRHADNYACIAAAAFSDGPIVWDIEE